MAFPIPYLCSLHVLFSSFQAFSCGIAVGTQTDQLSDGRCTWNRDCVHEDDSLPMSQLLLALVSQSGGASVAQPGASPSANHERGSVVPRPCSNASTVHVESAAAASEMNIQVPQASTATMERAASDSAMSIRVALVPQGSRGSRPDASAVLVPAWGSKGSLPHGTLSGAASLISLHADITWLKWMCLVFVSVSAFAVRRLLSNLFHGMPSVNGRVIGVILLGSFVRCLDYAVIIPTAWDLVASTGGNFAASGLIIGAYYASTIFGAGLLVALGQKWSFHCITITACAVSALASGSYGLICLGSKGNIMLLRLFVARCVSGLAEGGVAQLHHSTLVRISPKESVVNVYTLVTLMEALGLSTGPMVSSILLQHFLPVLPIAADIATPAAGPFAIGLLHAVVMLLALKLLPGEHEMSCAIKGLPAAPEDEDQSQSMPHSSRVFIASMFVMVSGLRYIVDAGIESATALVLELDYSWDLTTIGYMIGLCIGCYIPFYVCLESVGIHAGQKALQRSSLLAAFVMSWLLLPMMCSVLSRFFLTPSCAVWIITSDAVVWPMMALANGFSDGHAYLLVPEHADSIAFSLTVLNALGYGIGPALARYIWATGGMQHYGALQITLIGLALVINELGMHHWRCN